LIQLKGFTRGVNNKYKTHDIHLYKRDSPGEAKVYRTTMNNVVVYCSMMRNKLPTKNLSQIDYDAAKEFDALVSIPETRQRIADKIVTDDSKNEHGTKKPFRIGSRCGSGNKAKSRAPIMVSPVTTERMAEELPPERLQSTPIPPT